MAKTKLQDAVKELQPNLVVLTKFGDKSDVNPVEQLSLCNFHYSEVKSSLRGCYNISRFRSSMPETWCWVCSPPDWGYLTE